MLAEAVGTTAVMVPDLPENPDGDARSPEVSTARPPATVPRVGADPTRAGLRVAADAFGPDEPRDSIGLRTARWSYSLYRNGEGELYDLVRDPAQLENLCADSDPLRGARAAGVGAGPVRRLRRAGVPGILDRALRVGAEQVRAWTAAYQTGLDAIYGPHTG